MGEIDLPDMSYLETNIKDAALNGGLYQGSIGGNDSYYHVTLNEDELIVEPVKMKKNGKLQSLGAAVPWSIAGLNGSAWFDESVVIEGVLDGGLTICANGDILIYDDILYEGSTPGSGPDPDCDDVLGLVAVDDVIISYTNANKHDCEVHGVMMALEKNIEAEDYMHHAPRGDFVIYGGLIADYSIHLGQFDDGVCLSGYARDYRYDGRLFSSPPPFFPLTGHYTVYSWEEVVPPEA